MIKLGDKVRDKISGLVGTAMSKTEYLNGCVQYAVQTKYKKGTDEILAWNIDEDQLVVIKSKRPKRKGIGGPMTKISKEKIK